MKALSSFWSMSELKLRRRLYRVKRHSTGLPKRVAQLLLNFYGIHILPNARSGSGSDIGMLTRGGRRRGFWILELEGEQVVEWWNSLQVGCLWLTRLALNVILWRLYPQGSAI